MIEQRSLRELLPDYYEDVYEMKTLMKLEDDLNEVVIKNLQKVQESLYIQTAHEELLSFYESFFGINVNVDDTLEERRFRVLTRIISQPPFTPRYLEERLSMLGTDAKVIEHYQKYEVEIQTSLTQKGQVEELPYLFKTMIPSNLVVKSNNRLEVESSGALFFGHQTTYTNMFEITNDFEAEYASEGIMDSGSTITGWHEITTK